MYLFRCAAAHYIFATSCLRFAAHYAKDPVEFCVAKLLRRHYCAILPKTHRFRTEINTNYCFTPSSRSLHFAFKIQLLKLYSNSFRKISAHLFRRYFGIPSLRSVSLRKICKKKAPSWSIAFRKGIKLGKG